MSISLSHMSFHLCFTQHPNLKGGKKQNYTELYCFNSFYFQMCILNEIEPKNLTNKPDKKCF